MRFNKTANTFTINGETKSIAQWADAMDIDAKTIRSRLNTLGWNIERAILTPSTNKASSSARKKAKEAGELVYIGAPHRGCGSTIKYTSSGSCFNCNEPKN